MIRGYDSGRSHLLPFEATQHTKKGHTHIYIYIYIFCAQSPAQPPSFGIFGAKSQLQQLLRGSGAAGQRQGLPAALVLRIERGVEGSRGRGVRTDPGRGEWREALRCFAMESPTLKSLAANQMESPAW